MKILAISLEGPMLLVVLIVIALAGIVCGYFVRLFQHEKTLKKAKKQYDDIVDNAKKEALLHKEEAIKSGKKEVNDYRVSAENYIKERKNVVTTAEEKLGQRESLLDKRAFNLEKREENFNIKENKIDQQKEELVLAKAKINETINLQVEKLHEIASLTNEEAKAIIMEQVREKISHEIATFIKESEDEAKDIANARAKEIIAEAMQKYAGETTTERTISVVDIPNDDMKGRIIGREGRNIRAIEALTGVDLIIDDTPEAVILSGFDPIRREVAKKALSLLVADGRIHPARIEEVVEKSRSEVESAIREAGEEAVFKANIGRVHPELIKILGRLNYRTSYGQNVLKHSIETAFLAAKMAVELGENETIAKRAGLFHDIGKAVDHEVEGSHVDIGVELCKKYNEPKEVIDACASHHGDKEPESIIATIVAVADALSAARPGARNESVENYINRLVQLEEIGNSIKGVEKSFAIQAGREIRIIVKPDQIDDLKAIQVAHDVKEKIEANLSYPGTIKVTVIRETRATNIAK